ncbi:MAG: efflux RND transporter periplasmic adaptor subunit [Flavobacteriales bacterium]|nr:efflux RND transporter periplasmic adaptor subunit [Flavobacteriales bacterium]
MKKLFMLLGVTIFLTLSSCQSNHDEHHEEEAQFKVTSPLKMDTSITKDYVCQIHSISHIEVRSQERGYLQKFYVDEGQYVRQGQALFEIMPNLYAAEFHKAEAEAKLIEIEYLNTKALADSNIVSMNELAMAKARFDKAKAEVELAKLHLGFTLIKAPFDGIVGRFEARLGSLLDEGELITSLSDNSEMWVYFNVPEAEYLEYKSLANMDSLTLVKLQMANKKLFPFTGKIDVIEADFNNETGNIPFRATFPNPDKLLRHGGTGSIIMTIPHKEALLIPQKATFEVLDKKFVFVVDEENVVHTREIKIGAEMPHLFAVSKGLKEGDKILLEGLRKVRNNEEIDVEYEKPEDVITHLELYAE